MIYGMTDSQLAALSFTVVFLGVVICGIANGVWWLWKRIRR